MQHYLISPSKIFDKVEFDLVHTPILELPLYAKLTFEFPELKVEPVYSEPLIYIFQLATTS